LSGLIGDGSAGASVGEVAGVVAGATVVTGAVAGLAGTLLASGFGRYKGPRCPHAANMPNIATAMQKRAERAKWGKLKAAFTIKISV
jgi:hypothetical protein